MKRFLTSKPTLWLLWFGCTIGLPLGATLLRDSLWVFVLIMIALVLSFVLSVFILAPETANELTAWEVGGFYKAVLLFITGAVMILAFYFAGCVGLLLG